MCKCWPAPAGGVPWGPGGINSSCGDDALYFQDLFDLLAYTQKFWTLTAPSTVAGGLLYIPDASFAHAQRNDNLTAFTTGTGDFAFEAVLNFLVDGAPTGGTYDMISLLNGLGGGELWGSDTIYKNDATVRVDVDWSGLGLAVETLTLAAGVASAYTARVQRVSGTTTIWRDGVLKYTAFVLDSTNYAIRLLTNTTKGPGGAGPLCRQRWESFKFARC